MSYTCPVCGYPKLSRDPADLACFAICPSCGFEFGVTDRDLGYTYDQWRKLWIEKGMSWSSVGKKPADWNPQQQLLNLDKK